MKDVNGVPSLEQMIAERKVQELQQGFDELVMKAGAVKAAIVLIDPQGARVLFSGSMYPPDVVWASALIERHAFGS